MKFKMLLAMALSGSILFNFSIQKASAAPLKMRLVVVNPSDKKPQTKSVKSYLPKEVTAKDVLDNGGLDVEYDAEQGMFYAFKNDISLAPLETKVFEIQIKDVWLLPQEKLDDLRKQTETVLDHLKGSPYFEEADLLAKTIYGRLDQVKVTQEDQTVSRQQHIAYYRDNLKILISVQEDLDKLEKILVTVGGPPKIQLMEKSDVNLKSPSSKTTWFIIFAVLIFIAILSATFYFTWMRQAKLTENIFTAQKDSSFSEFNKTGGSGPQEKA